MSQTFEITSPDGIKYRVTGPDGATEQDALAQVQAQHSSPVVPPAKTEQEAPVAEGGLSKLAHGYANYMGSVIEPVANLASSVVATPIAGLVGLAQGAKNLVSPGMTAGNRIEQVQNALTYQPQTGAGQAVTGAVSYPFRKLSEFGDYVGKGVADSEDPAANVVRRPDRANIPRRMEGSPTAGAIANTAIQFLPSLLLKGRGSAASKAQSGAPAAASAAPAVAPEVVRAQNYVASRTGLDWNALSDAVKTRITDIAKDAGTLEKLDPASVERQARLESLPVPVPATRGVLTRDPVQLRNEGNVSATEAGKPIRDIQVAGNKAILQNLDVLKGKVSGTGKTAATAETPEQVGLSVQDASLRAKLKLKQQEVKDLYSQAEAAGELQGNAPTKPLARLIEETPDLQHLGWVQTWLNKADIVTDQTGAAMKGMRQKASLKELEDLRQAAVARAMDGGTEGYYAGKVINAIDQATDGAGGNAYKAARAARKQQALEFEDQGAVAQLVENKSRTDRAVALEDTWRKTVLGGSIQDLGNVKRSLLTGGNQATQLAGRKAWRDIRAQTVQHIINEATKSVTRYEDGSPNVTPAAMERAINSIGPQKLEAIFGQGTVRQLQRIMEATRDIKTEPPPGFKGSPTFANFIAFLEKGIGKIPVLGDTATGAVRGVVKLREMGAAGREVRAAQQTPLDVGVRESTNALRGTKNRNALSYASPSFIPAERGRD